jgi:hypothetical protein
MSKKISQDECLNCHILSDYTSTILCNQCNNATYCSLICLKFDKNYNHHDRFCKKIQHTKIFFDYNKYPDPNNKDYISEKDLKKYLEYCLKNKLNNPKSIFNAYNTNTITILVCILWFFIVVQAFNILFYYYRDIYSYILLFTTILIILIAIIWKMIYILNVNN